MDRTSMQHESNHGYGGHGGRHAGHGAPGVEMLKERFGGDEDAILLFVGSLNCIRHKPYMKIGELMRKGKAALLFPTMSDFSSGRYINQIENAMVELSNERGVSHFVITCGCQWVILSTDGELLVENMKQKHGITVTIWEDAHLEFGDHK